jgi:hypothetical protein
MSFFSDAARKEQARREYLEARLGPAGFKSLESLLDEATNGVLDAEASPSGDHLAKCLHYIVVEGDPSRTDLIEVLRGAIEESFLAGFRAAKGVPLKPSLGPRKALQKRNAAKIMEAWNAAPSGLGTEARVQCVIDATKLGRTTIYRHLRQMLLTD